MAIRVELKGTYTWATEKALVCTDDATATIQITHPVDGILYTIPRQVPGYTETAVYVGIGSDITVASAGVVTITEASG